MKKSKKPQKSKKKVAKVKPRQKVPSKVPSFGLIPLGDRVLVEELKGGVENKTESGIYIPSSVKEDRGSKRGKVVAVGRGKTEDGKHVAVSVSIGDEVLYGWGDSVVYEGKEYTLVRDGDISAIIR